MKIARITYLFALCPALLVGMTSCGSSSDKLPGKALSYEEMYNHIKESSPEFNLRNSLAKSADITASIKKFTIDGKAIVLGSEPTNIRFTLPAQDDYKFTLNNETGVEGALEVRERLSGDVPATYNANKGAQFGGNFIYNCIFNPFFTTYTLTYLDTMIKLVDDLNIVNEKFSLDGETAYVSYSIPDLKTFSELADEYELGTGSKLFTVFRGTDGHVAVTFAFNKDGYVSSVALVGDSNDIALIGDSKSGEETFRGLANFDLTIKIKQNLYQDSDYHLFSAADYASNEELSIRKVKASEYMDMGFNTRKLDVNFVQYVLDNYSDVILPGYGADFVIEHKGKTSNSNNMVINVDGVNYPISSFIVEPEDGVKSMVYNWSANGATMADGETRNGRSVINYGGKLPPIPEIDSKTYYLKDKYTFVPSIDTFDQGITGEKAALFEEMLKIKTVDGHKRSSVNYFFDSNIAEFVKDSFRFEKAYDLIGNVVGKKLYIYSTLPYITQDLSTEVNALPYGYAQYSFRLPDGGIDSQTGSPYGIKYGENFTTRTDVAEMVNADGTATSHGILDIYNNVDAAKGTYTTPIIRPAKGFKINPMIKEEDFKKVILEEIMVSGAEYKLTENDISKVNTYKDAKGNITGFDFTLSKDCIDKTKQMIQEKTDFAAPFKLVDYANTKRPYDPAKSIFVRDIVDDFKTDGAHSYISFNLFDASSNSSPCFNPSNGLEEGISEATVKTVKAEKEDVKILEFEDFTIRADDGYRFREPFEKVDPNFGNDATDSYIFSNIGNRYIPDDKKEISRILWSFAKLSNDKKELTFSVQNVLEKDRINNLNALYNMIASGGESGAPVTHLKLNINASNIVQEENPYYLSAGRRGESFNCMNVVPGPDYTYVQILPEYTDTVNKDLKFIFDF